MTLYKRKGSSLWWASLSVPGLPQIRRSTGTASKSEANRIHDQWKAELWQQPQGPEHMLSDAVKLWTEAAPRSPSEILSLSKFFRYFPDLPVQEVTREGVHKALGAFCRTAGTYTRYRTMISAVLNVAKAEGWVKEVPKLATLKGKAKPRVWLTKQQWKELYDELPQHLKPAALFAVSTGLRQANVLGLQWKQVDLSHRIAWVEGHDAKAGRGIPVPLSDEALEALHSVHGQHNLWCFTYRGKPFKDVKSGFIPACIRAGLGSYVDGKYSGFTWHGLRHTWATWHIQAGTPVEVLQKLGAWSDMRMVMTYAHLSAGHIAQFANNSKTT